MLTGGAVLGHLAEVSSLLGVGHVDFGEAMCVFVFYCDAETGGWCGDKILGCLLGSGLY